MPNLIWDKGFEMFKERGCDAFFVVSPSKNELQIADAEAISQITTRRNDFPKPLEMYGSLDLYGKNVVTLEGQMWRHHRKITSPPFTEKNNQMVWKESLYQAEQMLIHWIGKRGATSSEPISASADDAMRLSLHVISRAGFGVGLKWPHQGDDNEIPPGHTLTYKQALERVLHGIIIVMLTPKWILKRAPFKFMRDGYEAYREWGLYMRELYEAKRKEVLEGQAVGDMDLMGALVKGAGITQDTVADGKKSSGAKQLLTDDEILGNVFVFILAGHETAANTINFSVMMNAMEVESQKNLQADLDQILGDRPPSQWSYEEDLPKLFGGMCGAVMNEELRLIPPVVGIPKSTLAGSPQGLQLSGGRSVTVPGGTYITLNTAALHRNPKNWPHTSEEDLLAFRPERWLLDPTKATGAAATGNDDAYAEEPGLDFDGPDRRADTAAGLFRPARGAYIPFSEGYRSCLGRRFAQVEILAVLAVIFKTWSVELDVREYLSDEAFEKASEAEQRAAWQKAYDHAKDRLKNGMGTIITIQMRKGKVPFRLVKRGEERFAFMWRK